jgi:hypothetical protein
MPQIQMLQDVFQTLSGSRQLTDGSSVWTADELREQFPRYDGSQEALPTLAYLAPDGIWQQQRPEQEFTLWFAWIDEAGSF